MIQSIAFGFMIGNMLTLPWAGGFVWASGHYKLGISVWATDLLLIALFWLIQEYNAVDS